MAKLSSLGIPQAGTIAEREAIPVGLRKRGLRFLATDITPWREFEWRLAGDPSGARGDGAPLVSQGWVGLFTAAEEKNLGIGFFGQLQQSNIAGLVDALAFYDAADFTVGISDFRARALTSTSPISVAISWEASGNPTSFTLSWGTDYAVTLGGGVRTFQPPVWSQQTRVTAIGDSMVEKPWVATTAAELGLTLNNVAKYSSGALQPYRLGTRQLRFTVTSGIVPASGTGVLVTSINGAVPGFVEGGDGFEAQRFLNTYPGDTISTNCSVTGWYGGRHGAVSVPNGGTPTYTFTPDDGLGASAVAAQSVFIPDNLAHLAVDELWVRQSQNYVYADYTPAFPNNINPRVLDDIQAIVDQMRGQRGIFLALTPPIGATTKLKNALAYFDNQLRVLWPQYAAYLTNVSVNGTLFTGNNMDFVRAFGSDGSQADEDAKAAGEMPISCMATTDVGEVHFNAKGQGLEAQFLKLYRVAQKVPPALTLGAPVEIEAFGSNPRLGTTSEALMSTTVVRGWESQVGRLASALLAFLADAGTTTQISIGKVFEYVDAKKRVAFDMLANGVVRAAIFETFDLTASKLRFGAGGLYAQASAGKIFEYTDAKKRIIYDLDYAGKHRMLSFSAALGIVDDFSATRVTIAGGATAQASAGKVVEYTDAKKRIIFDIDFAGKARMVSFSAWTGAVTDLTATRTTVGPGGAIMQPSAGKVVEYTDAKKRTIYDLDNAGKHRMLSCDVRDAIIRRQFRAATDKRRGAFRAEINHILHYGQSWSLGFDAQSSSLTANLYDTLMFNANSHGGGIRQLYSVAADATALQSFVAAAEANETGSPEFPAGVLGETGALAMANTVKALILAENNLSPAEQAYQLLVSAPGEGSKNIEDLADNANPYMQRLKEQIARGFAIAQAQGKTYNVPAVTWLQGGTAVSPSYAEQLENMRADISAYARSVTGQDNEVLLVVWQQYPWSNDDAAPNGSARSVYTRYVLAADTYPYIVCSGPSYQYPQNSAANIHYKATGMAGIGADLGQAVKRAVIDGIDFQPLKPLALRRQGKIGLLKLNISEGMALMDTAQVVAAANCGFNLYDSSGNPLTITAVGIAQPDLIKITASAAIPAGAVLRYADLGTDAADATKWRGNIRDNLSDLGQRDRWLVAFSYPFSN